MKNQQMLLLEASTKQLVICWNIDVDHFLFLDLEYQKRKGNEEEPVNLFVYRALFEDVCRVQTS